MPEEAASATGDLVVTVISRADGSPVAGASVVITGPASQSIDTDESGRASFSGIPAGSYNARAGHSDFESATSTVTVNAGASNAATLQLQRIPTELMVIEVAFSSNHVVDNDTLGPFGPPEWRYGRASHDQSPVCYTRTVSVSLSVKFRVTRQPTATESVQFRGRATFGANSLEWSGQLTVNPGDAEVNSTIVTSSGTLPDHVGCYDPLSIDWEYNPANTRWNSAGTSAHVFYVVFGNPTGTPVYWTLLEISCRAAHGETTESGVISRGFVPFTGLSLTRKRDGRELTYWMPDTTRATNTRELLSSSDGSGQCGSWAELLIDMWKCHGITSADKILVVRGLSTNVGFLVKNWRFIGTGSLAPPFTHELGTECVKLPGIAGQRNPNPPPAFQNHFIVKVGLEYFDPSYGAGPKANPLEWENGAIDGLSRGLGAGFQKSSHRTTRLLEFWNLRTRSNIP